MRNLLLFVWKYRLTLQFLLLQLVAFSLLFQTQKFHKAQFINSANTVTGGFYSVISNITEYFELKDVNDQLAIENAKLRSVTKNSFIKLRGPLIYINDTLYTQQYKYLKAKVVNNSTNKANNYIIINQGSEQGIEHEMGVISSNGIVGIVKDVSEHYSSVISLLHSSTSISAKLKKNNYFGLISWDGYNPKEVTLNDIPKHVELSIGDTVVTRGSSTIFPTNVPIGTVKSFEPIEGSDFYNIKLNLGVDFGNISYVYVIKNMLKNEQIELEKRTEEGDN